MFELLKNKLSSFASKIKKKAEEKLESVPKPKVLFEGKPAETVEKAPKERPIFIERPPEKPIEELVVPREGEEPKESPIEKPKPAPAEPEPIEERVERIEEALEKKPKKEPVQEPVPEKPAMKEPVLEKPLEEPKPEETAKKEPPPKEEPVEKPKPEETAREEPPLEEKPAEKPEPLPIEKPEKGEPKEEPEERPREEEFKLNKMSEMLKEPGEAQMIPGEDLPVEEPEEPPGETQSAEEAPAEAPPEPAPKPEQIEEEKRELKTKVGAIGALKGAIRGYTELRESDITDLLFELELSLLEADVNHETATALIKKIKELLLKEKISRGIQIDEFLKQKIKQALVELTSTGKIDLFEAIEHSPKPFKILLLGPNGAGKTTTIAKLSFAMQLMEKSVIWAAADTFRAASIEQLEEHAKRLSIRVVKHNYGSDPSAVAFDAVKAAEAGRIDVVMIDSAGRQETNRNLIEELKKLDRVIKPDLKIFVGEAFAGKNLIEQARAFDEALSLDGFILTKIDTDPKGGTVISLLYELKKPVLFIGTGQGYEDLKPFTPEFIIDRII